MSLVKGTHHVALKCSGPQMYEKAIQFYHNILGMEIVRFWGNNTTGGTMFNTGNSLIELFASGSVSDSTGSINHFALATDNVDACIKAVREAGYTIKVEPGNITIKSVPPYPIRMAFCIGPVGEEIEFFTEC